MIFNIKHTYTYHIKSIRQVPLIIIGRKFNFKKKFNQGKLTFHSYRILVDSKKQEDQYYIKQIIKKKYRLMIPYKILKEKDLVVNHLRL